MIDLEVIEDKTTKVINHLQHHYNLSHRDMANLLLPLGIDYYLKDLATRRLNGDKAPYLADFHLRQGFKYYEQDLMKS